MDEIKKLIIDVILKAVMAKLVTAIPFLGMPFLGPLVGFFVGKLLNMVGDELALMVEFKVIDIKVGKEVKGYEEAVLELKTELDKPIKDEVKINEAKDRFKEKLRDLIDMRPK